MDKPEEKPMLPSMEQVAANYSHMILKNSLNGILLEFKGRLPVEALLMIFTSETARIMGGVAAKDEATVLKIRHNFRKQFRESMETIPADKVVMNGSGTTAPAPGSAQEPTAAA